MLQACCPTALLKQRALSPENFFLLASKVLGAQELRMSDWGAIPQEKTFKGTAWKAWGGSMQRKVEDNDFCSVPSLCGP